jgi:hypothetical protein
VEVMLSEHLPELLQSHRNALIRLVLLTPRISMPIPMWSVLPMMMVPGLELLELGMLLPLLMPGLSSRRCVVSVLHFRP